MAVEYTVFKIHYGFTSNLIPNQDFSAEVAPTGLHLYDRLTESEILLRNQIGRDTYVYGIERTNKKSDITGVISNTLTPHRRIDAMEPGYSEMSD